MITDTHSSLTVKPNTGMLHRQTLSISEVCRNKSVLKMFSFSCVFLLSLHLVLLPPGSVAKVSFRFPGEENLALRQCRMLFTAATNDSFFLEQQCGYNSTLLHNVYDYFHWSKDLVAFCTSFIWSCSEVLHTDLGNRLTLHVCGTLSWIQYLFSLFLSFRLDYLVWYVQILESLSERCWKNMIHQIFVLVVVWLAKLEAVYGRFMSYRSFCLHNLVMHFY